MITRFLQLRNSWTSLVAVLAFISCFAAAQTPASAPPPVKIPLGDPRVDGSFLKPYKNTWKVVYAFPGKDPFLVGTWTDELTEVEVGGRHLLQRTQVANYAKYRIMTTNTNIFDPKTMIPVSMEFKRSDTGEWTRRDFSGATVKYRHETSGDAAKAETGEIKVEEPVFDYNGGMYGVLLAALPLKEGFTGTLPTLDDDGRGELEQLTFTVLKEEMVEAGPGKQVMAWPVEVDDVVAPKNPEKNPDKNPKGTHSIFWVSKEAPYVIKLVTIIPSGKWVTITIAMM